jgi:hypothetical protein
MGLHSTAWSHESTGSDATIDQAAALRILDVRSPGTATPDTGPARAGRPGLKVFCEHVLQHQLVEA